jgi:hypothetical protein
MIIIIIFTIISLKYISRVVTLIVIYKCFDIQMTIYFITLVIRSKRVVH